MIAYERELNPEQYRVVTEKGGPILVLAGAGSGKTRTLTYRVARLLEDGVPPERILLATFTNKAAREMRERLWTLLENQHPGQVPRSFMPWMGTFHGICVKLLRLDGAAIGVRPNFVIYDEDDKKV